jgi:hypothetical protein
MPSPAYQQYVPRAGNLDPVGDGQPAPRARLPLMGASGTSHASGLVPDPGASAGSTRYLREDATWAAPAGGGAVTSVAGRTGAVTLGEADVAGLVADLAAVRSVAVASDLAGAGVVPAYAGQIGTKRSDGSVWVANSTTAGDWSPARVGFAATAATLAPTTTVHLNGQTLDADGGALVNATLLQCVGAARTFADASDRATATPANAGQLGVQIDDGSAWRANSTTAGDWSQSFTFGAVAVSVLTASGPISGGNYLRLGPFDALMPDPSWAGRAMEFGYWDAGDYGLMQCYDRSGAGYKNFKIDAATLFLNTSSGGPVNVGGTLDAPGYSVGGVGGWSGTYVTGDGRTATVAGGLITSVV